MVVHSWRFTQTTSGSSEFFKGSRHNARCETHTDYFLKHRQKDVSEFKNEFGWNRVYGRCRWLWLTNEFQDLILGLSVQTREPVNGNNSEVKFSVASNGSIIINFLPNFLDFSWKNRENDLAGFWDIMPGRQSDLSSVKQCVEKRKHFLWLRGAIL